MNGGITIHPAPLPPDSWLCLKELTLRHAETSKRDVIASAESRFAAISTRSVRVKMLQRKDYDCAPLSLALS